MSETDNKLKRLQEARKKAEEVSKRRQRIAGELDGHKKRQAELEQKCREDYGCEIGDLPKLSAQLETEAEKSIVEAERLLTVPAASSKPVEPVKPAEPIKPAESVKPPVRRSPITKPRVEDDVL